MIQKDNKDKNNDKNNDEDNDEDDVNNKTLTFIEEFKDKINEW